LHKKWMYVAPHLLGQLQVELWKGVEITIQSANNT